MTIITNQIRSNLRKIWSMYAVERDMVLFQARVEEPRKTKAGELAKVPKILYVCATCKERFPMKDVQVDHIDEVGKTPDTYAGWGAWIARLFTPASNLQVLCIPCHKKKTLQFRRNRANV